MESKKYERKFSQEIYNKFNWLCGCQQNRALFCYPGQIDFGGDQSWTNVGLHNLFKAKEISPSEFVKLTQDQTKAIEGVNAYIRLTSDVQNVQANYSDTLFKDGRPRSVLEGVPISIKDNFCIKNVPTTCASRMLQDFTPTYTATVVRRLIAAGVNIVGKTNMDEFAMGSGTTDSIYGPTNNPWGGGKHIAGGSSGGSAVAVATGASVGALGSDTGGSVRNPASYCGVVGLKPTYGLVSRHGLIPLVNSMDVPGVLTRNVADSSHILNVIAGWDPLDSTTVRRPFKKIVLSEGNSVKNIRVGIPVEYHSPGLSKEVLTVWDDIAKLLTQRGAIVSQVSLPHTALSIACYSILNQAEVASNMARYTGLQFGYRAEENKSTEQLYSASRAAGFGQVVRGRILAGNYFLLKRNYEQYFVKAMQIRRLISDDFKRVWNSGIDILLTPTTLGTAPTYDEFVGKENREQCAVQDFCTQPANMSGCPAISIPIKLSDDNLPISLQLMSPNFREDILLNCAHFIEKELNFDKFR